MPPTTTMSHSRPLKNIWIFTQGSRGDIQPYIAVGAALVEAGYRVTLLGPDGYQSMAENFGLDYVPLCPSPDTVIREEAFVQKAMMSGDPSRVVSVINQVTRQAAPQMVGAFETAFQEKELPDLCLSHPLILYFPFYLALQHQVPYLLVTTYEVLHNPDHPVLGIPKLPCCLNWLIIKYFQCSLYDFAAPYEEVHKGGVLKVVTRWHFWNRSQQPVFPTKVLLAPEIFDVVCGGRIPPMSHYMGATVLPQQPAHLDSFGGDESLRAIQAFLGEGDDNNNTKSQPIYLGWGSMLCKSSEYMTELCVRALQHAGVRAIVLSGLGALGCDKLSDPDLEAYARANILFVPHAPHEWLFARVAATVHHGGAGTTTAALRAGVPTVITPVLFDQHDWSYAVRELGVGVGLTTQLRHLKWQALGDAIATVVSDPGMADRARALGERLRAQNGAATTVRHVEAFWKEYCQTGVFHELFPPGQSSTTLSSKVDEHDILTSNGNGDKDKVQ